MRRFWNTLLATVGLSFALAIGASAADAPRYSTGTQGLDRAIYHELIMMPQLTIFDDLSFQVNDGTVTLTGEVRNPILKDEAPSVIKRLAGVDHINNEIEILPASFNDDRIRRETARAIFRDDQLFGYSLGAYPPIHIIVKHGHVVLKGVVARESDKDAAGIRANGVSGVFSVDNELRVEKN
jgi:hyperosmotically inducible periplasmic protein